MMEGEATKDETQIQTREKQTAQDVASTSTNNPKPKKAPNTTRPKRAMGKTRNKAISSQENMNKKITRTTNRTALNKN